MAGQKHEPTRAREVSIALQTDKTPTRYATLARAAEDLGFDGVSVFADLGFQPPALALGALAAATTRVRIGRAPEVHLAGPPRRRARRYLGRAHRPLGLELRTGGEDRRQCQPRHGRYDAGLARRLAHPHRGRGRHRVRPA